jgi:general secretion pathway protein G
MLASSVPSRTFTLSAVDEWTQCGDNAAAVRSAGNGSRSPRAVLRLLASAHGFSLIELLVVIIILGLVAGLVGPRLFGRVGQSKQGIAKAQIELFGAALDQYRLDVGSYPAGAAGLQALVQNPNAPSWNGPYLKKNVVPLDPWGRPYQYKCCPGDHGDYDIWSLGADGAPGGEGENADVTSSGMK